MKLNVLLLVILFTTNSIIAAELTVKKHPIKTEKKDFPAGNLTSVTESERTDYLRNKASVASVVKVSQKIGDIDPLNQTLIQFLLDKENWVEVDISRPSDWKVISSRKIAVVAQAGLIFVGCAELDYFEVYYLPKSRFLDGEERLMHKQSFLKPANPRSPFK